MLPDKICHQLKRLWNTFLLDDTEVPQVGHPFLPALLRGQSTHASQTVAFLHTRLVIGDNLHVVLLLRPGLFHQGVDFLGRVAARFRLWKQLGVVNLAEFHKIIWFQHVHRLQLQVWRPRILSFLTCLDFCLGVMSGEIARLLEYFDHFGAEINRVLFLERLAALVLIGFIVVVSGFYNCSLLFFIRLQIVLLRQFLAKNL